MDADLINLFTWVASLPVTDFAFVTPDNSQGRLRAIENGKMREAANHRAALDRARGNGRAEIQGRLDNALREIERLKAARSVASAPSSPRGNPLMAEANAIMQGLAKAINAQPWTAEDREKIKAAVGSAREKLIDTMHALYTHLQDGGLSPARIVRVADTIIEAGQRASAFEQRAAALENDLQQATETLRSKEDVALKLQEDVSGERARVVALQEQLQQHGRVRETDERVAALEGEKRVLVERIERLTAEENVGRGLVQELEEAKQQKLDLEDTLTRTQEELTKAFETILTAEGVETSLTAELERARKSLEDSKTAAATLQEESGELSGKLQQKEAEVEELRNVIRELSNELQRNESREYLASKEEELQELRDAEARMTEQLRLSDDRVAAQQRAIQDLESQKDAILQTVVVDQAVAKEQLEESHRRYKQKEESLLLLQRDVASFKERIKELEEEKQKAADKSEVANAELLSLRANMESAVLYKDEISTLKNNIDGIYKRTLNAVGNNTLAPSLQKDALDIRSRINRLSDAFKSTNVGDEHVQSMIRTVVSLLDSVATLADSRLSEVVADRWRAKLEQCEANRRRTKATAFLFPMLWQQDVNPEDQKRVQDILKAVDDYWFRLYSGEKFDPYTIIYFYLTMGLDCVDNIVDAMDRSKTRTYLDMVFQAKQVPRLNMVVSSEWKKVLDWEPGLAPMETVISTYNAGDWGPEDKEDPTKGVHDRYVHWVRCQLCAEVMFQHKKEGDLVAEPRLTYYTDMRKRQKEMLMAEHRKNMGLVENNTYTPDEDGSQKYESNVPLFQRQARSLWDIHTIWDAEPEDTPVVQFYDAEDILKFPQYPHEKTHPDLRRGLFRLKGPWRGSDRRKSAGIPLRSSPLRRTSAPVPQKETDVQPNETQGGTQRSPSVKSIVQQLERKGGTDATQRPTQTAAALSTGRQRTLTHQLKYRFREVKDDAKIESENNKRLWNKLTQEGTTQYINVANNLPGLVEKYRPTHSRKSVIWTGLGVAITNFLKSVTQKTTSAMASSSRGPQGDSNAPVLDNELKAVLRDLSGHVRTKTDSERALWEKLIQTGKTTYEEVADGLRTLVHKFGMRTSRKLSADWIRLQKLLEQREAYFLPK